MVAHFNALDVILNHMANFNHDRGGRGFERRSFNDRGRREPVEMHQAICDNCRKNCEVPFRPTNGKPLFCSDCFKDKKGNGDRNREQSQSQPQFKEQFEVLNNKLDKILAMLTPAEV